MTAAANATDKACLIMSFISFWVLICISPCLKKSAKLLSPFKNVHSSSPPRRIVPPAAAVAATRSVSDSVFHCRKEEWFRLQNATTPRLQRFLISRGKLWNRCKETLKNSQTAASILDFRARLANRCRFCLFMPCCVHRFLISGLDLRIDASFSPFKPFCVQ